MKDSLRFPVILGVICIVAAAGVGGTYVFTREKIADRLAERREFSLREVFGGDAVFKVVRDSDDPLEQIREVSAKGGGVIGYIATGTAQGYSSRLQVMVGTDVDVARIQGIKILFQQETPGLGARVGEVKTDETWVRKLSGQGSATGEKKEPARPWFEAMFEGAQVPAEGEAWKLMTKSGEAGEYDEYDGITGATITSDAVDGAVRDAVAKVRGYLKAKAEAAP
ncbi:MAG: FMN-binding protein [Bradyrhizobium sp.]|nr:FMN-binding protein [Bradyrhizobium sp.]